MSSAAGFRLPDQKFFEPTEEFIRIMKNYHDLIGDGLLFDIGAGKGHVSRMLADSGLHPIAIDVNHRSKEEYPILHLNAIGYNYPDNAILMFCRPCHGYFVESILHKANNVGLIVYVGLKKNVEDDLGPYFEKFTQVHKDTVIGSEDEKIWIWKIGEK